MLQTEFHLETAEVKPDLSGARTRKRVNAVEAWLPKRRKAVEATAVLWRFRTPWRLKLTMIILVKAFSLRIANTARLSATTSCPLSHKRVVAVTSASSRNSMPLAAHRRDPALLSVKSILIWTVRLLTTTTITEYRPHGHQRFKTTERLEIQQGKEGWVPSQMRRTACLLTLTKVAKSVSRLITPTLAGMSKSAWFKWTMTMIQSRTITPIGMSSEVRIKAWSTHHLRRNWPSLALGIAARSIFSSSNSNRTRLDCRPAAQPLNTLLPRVCFLILPWDVLRCSKVPKKIMKDPRIWVQVLLSFNSLSLTRVTRKMPSSTKRVVLMDLSSALRLNLHRSWLQRSVCLSAKKPLMMET